MCGPGAHAKARQLADNEDDHDSDQNPRVFSVIVVAARGVLLGSVGRAYCTDQPVVTERERRERNEKSKDEEEAGFVDEEVYCVHTQRGPLQRDARTVDDYVRRRDRDYSVSQENPP